jgi:Protein of unknown function (DUF433)
MAAALSECSASARSSAACALSMACWRRSRILAETILSYLRADCPAEEIFRDYPSLPVDGIDAVARWAETTYGPGWRSAEAPAPQH